MFFIYIFNYGKFFLLLHASYMNFLLISSFILPEKLFQDLTDIARVS